jgi:hypothetical protein
MQKALRILAGVVVIGLIFYAASRAVRDCLARPYIYENCLWLWLRDGLHLPQSKLLRAVVLEVVGLALLAGLYITVRFLLWPARIAQTIGSDGPARRSPDSASVPPRDS